MPSAETPLEELERVIASIGDKADKNKNRARLATILLTAATALIPVCIGLGGGFWVGRFAPSLLAAAAAIGSAWVQIERPHERWNLYRRYHRMFEMERLKYLNRIPPYESDNADVILVNVLTKGQMDLHDEWAGLLPQTSEVASLGKAASSR